MSASKTKFKKRRNEFGGNINSLASLNPSKIKTKIVVPLINQAKIESKVMKIVNYVQNQATSGKKSLLVKQPIPQNLDSKTIERSCRP